MKIRNEWSNHTGLGAVNLLLNNVWVMYKYDIRTKGKPHFGWRKATTKLICAAIFGWFGKHSLLSCRIVK